MLGLEDDDARGRDEKRLKDGEIEKGEDVIVKGRV